MDHKIQNNLLYQFKILYLFNQYLRQNLYNITFRIIIIVINFNYYLRFNLKTKFNMIKTHKIRRNACKQEGLSTTLVNGVGSFRGLARFWPDFRLYWLGWFEQKLVDGLRSC